MGARRPAPAGRPHPAAAAARMTPDPGARRELAKLPVAPPRPPPFGRRLSREGGTGGPGFPSDGAPPCAACLPACRLLRPPHAPRRRDRRPPPPCSSARTLRAASSGCGREGAAFLWLSGRESARTAGEGRAVFAGKETPLVFPPPFSVLWRHGGGTCSYLLPCEGLLRTRLL